MKHTLRLSSVFLAGLALMGAAQATTYRWTWSSAGHVNGNQPGGGDLWYNANGGAVRNINTTYNANSQRFTYDVEFGAQDTNGYWLVVSPGENPKGHAGQLAIFFVDASTSTPAVLAYAYNGVNGHQSWQDGSPMAGVQAPDLIQSSLTNSNFVNALQVQNLADGGRRISMDLNATAIQGHLPKYPGPQGQSEWTGTSFGNRFGIWFHPVKGLQTQYTQGGALSSWSFRQEGWVDGGNLEAVPEPATMTALGLGVAAMLRKRKAKKA